jgi:hypothetical protein
VAAHGSLSLLWIARLALTAMKERTTTNQVCCQPISTVSRRIATRAGQGSAGTGSDDNAAKKGSSK